MASSARRVVLWVGLLMGLWWLRSVSPFLFPELAKRIEGAGDKIPNELKLLKWIGDWLPTIELTSLRFALIGAFSLACLIYWWRSHNDKIHWHKALESPKEFWDVVHPATTTPEACAALLKDARRTEWARRWLWFFTVLFIEVVVLWLANAAHTSGMLGGVQTVLDWLQPLWIFPQWVITAL